MSSHTPLIRSPALDPFLDLLAIEVVFERLLGKLHNFVIAGKAQRDQLAFR